MMVELINPNPTVHQPRRHQPRKPPKPGGGADADDADVVGPSGREPIDAWEVYEHVRDIVDPEHPYTLEQLRVVEEELIAVDDAAGSVSIRFTPTVEHCSMATLIGLCLRTQLQRVLPPRFKIAVQLTPGSHSSEAAVNKQLNDKERVAAALESPALSDMVDRCLSGKGAAAAPGD